MSKRKTIEEILIKKISKDIRDSIDRITNEAITVASSNKENKKRLDIWKKMKE